MNPKEKARQEAVKWLHYLRRGTIEYEWALSYLREQAEKGGFALAELGTNKEELKKLRAKANM